MKGQSNRRERLQGESGLGLIEVMVSALIIGLIAAATVSSIGASQKVASKTRARAITSNLLEQDQERMRAFRATDLANYTASRTVLSDGISYNVSSESEFVLDESGTEISCTSVGSQSRYLRLTTTVTPQSTLKADPQSVASMYALPISQYSPTSGTLIVNIFKADGVTGVQGVPVSISGPDSETATTNDRGCAIFQFLTPGSYSINVNRSGYVNVSGVQNVTFSGTVSAGNINQATPLLYDVPGTINVTTTTVRNDGVSEPAHTGAVPITLSNGGIPNTGLRTSPTSSMGALFPFTGPYTAYSGGCTVNDPSSPSTQRNYFTTAPGNASTQVVAPGGSYNVSVREPAIWTAITAKGFNNSDPTSSNITVRLRDPSCAVTAQTYGTSVPYNGTSSARGKLVRAGYPMGTYQMCVSATLKYDSSNNTRVYSKTVTGINNFAYGGMTAATTGASGTTVALTTSDTQAACAF